MNENYFIEQNFSNYSLIKSYSWKPLKQPIFDMVIDRSAITCNSYEDAVIILKEVKRVMKKNGKMRSVIYSDKYTTINGSEISRNSYENFKTGMFVGHGTVLMLGEKDLKEIDV